MYNQHLFVLHHFCYRLYFILTLGVDTDYRKVAENLMTEIYLCFRMKRIKIQNKLRAFIF